MGASQSHLVQAYSWDGDSEGVTTRFTGDVTCLATAGSLIAAGSDDMTAKLVNTEDCEETLLEGHQGPILSIALVKQGDALATASCDGTVRLWNPTTKAVLKTLQNVVAKSSDVNNSSSLVGLQVTCLTGPK